LGGSSAGGSGGAAQQRAAGGRRLGLGAALGHLDGAPTAGIPVWARRATGAPLIGQPLSGGGDGLIKALSEARAPEEVVHVLMERSRGLDATGSSLPKPALRVIEQIRSQAQKAHDDAESVSAAPSLRGERGPVRSSARVVRGFTGLRGPRARRRNGLGDDKVMKLAQKLQNLIHLAESRRDDARKQVRMAEDSAAAMSEAQAPEGQGSGQDEQASIDALIQEVLAAVNREFELRRERRQEEPDGRSNWW